MANNNVFADKARDQKKVELSTEHKNAKREQGFKPSYKNKKAALCNSYRNNQYAMFMQYGYCEDDEEED